MELRSAAVTDAGRIRSINQDRFLIVADRIFVVADGMGGHRGGEVAAQMTVEALGANPDSIQSTRDLVTRIEQTNQTVLERSNDDPELRGMGTTVTAVALFNPEAKNPVVSIINVGDSRTYRMRAGELEQLTEDHSVVAELMRTGRLSPEEARGHRQRSVLTRAVGVEEQIETDTLEVLVNHSDRFLLCSDGLYSEVTDVRIAAVLRQLGDPADAAKELVRLALQNGGRDNVTVLIIDVHDDRDPSYVASQTLSGAATFGGSSVEPYATTPAAVAKTNHTDPITINQPKKVKGAARKPWAVNLRVLLFIGILAALGAVVAWVITAGKDLPTDRRIITSETTETNTTLATSPGSTILGQLPAIPGSTLVGGGAPNATNDTASNPDSATQNSENGTGTTAATTEGSAPGLAGNPAATGPGIVASLVPTTLDPFDPAPRVKPKAKAKAKSKSKNTTRTTAKKRKAAVVKKVAKSALSTNQNARGIQQ
jgi:PPM family protein phosphatase